MSVFKTATFALCILFAACQYFPESEFALSPESRLPRWFQQPSGVARSDLSVKALYYLDHTAFVLRNERTGRQLAKVDARILNKYSLELPNSRRPNGVTPDYDIVSADGIVEILEFNTKDPVFTMLDDPSLRIKLLTMTGNAALLK
jgi:hypothetical protein